MTFQVRRSADVATSQMSCVGTDIRDEANQRAVASVGQKTIENERLKKAVEYDRQNKWIAYVSLLPEDGE